MNKFVKIASATAVAGVLALALATPSEARNGRNAAAIGGFAAGAVVGAAVANSNNGYYADDYAYSEPTYRRSYYDADTTPYAYEPAPRYYYNGRNTMDRNCGGSPGKSNFTSCGSN